jgi:hypothetical protein
MYPNFIPNSPIFNSIPYGIARMSTTRGPSLLAKLGLTGKSINWGGLLNNASKTLGVVNQAIPLVKQAGPMFNNMKSMMRLASVFKDETDNSPRISKASNNSQKSIVKENSFIDNYQYNKPSFFV